MSVLFFSSMAATVFLTSLLSGVFGMAGGLILLWVLMFVAPVSTAIAVHGIVQMVSNSSRAWFSRAFLAHSILFILIAGLAVAASLLLLWIIVPALLLYLWLSDACRSLSGCRSAA